MTSFQAILLVENSVYSSFLASRWMQNARRRGRTGTILIGGVRPSLALLEQRREFHRIHAGERHVTDELAAELRALYSDFNEVALLMTDRLGVPSDCLGAGPESEFLGEDVNSEVARGIVNQVCAPEDPTTIFFVFVDQVLGPWWLTVAGGRILNGHPAVLPHARGVRAIEGVARLRDVALFRRAAGATVHYIDAGIDTGPIARCERLLDPFRFESLSELRACLFDLTFTLLSETADRLMLPDGTLPVGVKAEGASLGPLFLRRESTEVARRDAAEAYLSLRRIAR